jgi:leader peptidase (prepilin peptidase)/N-methyltransferase
MTLLIGWTAVLGLAVGSFLNVVIHRVPAGLSVTSPPSSCPACGHHIRNRHNVPIVGWLVLRGRCADCHAGISPRYPLVELLTGALFAALAWRMDELNLTSALPAFCCFAAAGIALAAIDLDLRILPNRIVLPSLIVVALLLVLASAINGDWWALARAALGSLGLFLAFFGLVLIYPKGMGFGDVKLAALVGLVLGYLSWQALIVGAFLGFLLGAIVGVAVISVGRGSRKSALAFGPFMIAGAFVVIFAAHPIASIYLRAVGR